MSFTVVKSRPEESLCFETALAIMKKGALVARDGWNGKNMFLYLVAGSSFGVNRPPLIDIFPVGYRIDYSPHIDMYTAQGSCVPWIASQVDLLASDWHQVVVEPEVAPGT